MKDFERGFKTPNSFRVRSRHRESEDDKKCERSHNFSRYSYSTPPTSRLGFGNCGNASRSSPYVSGHTASQTKQVCLYKWFLIKPVGNNPENDINHNAVQVALGGYTTSDLLDGEIFTTAAIESRIGKCELRTVDGLNIRLMGSIDEQCTYNNDFPFQVIHLFLTGFPFHWNLVINMFFGQLRLSRSALSARQADENAGQQKDEALNSEHVGKQIKGVGTGKLCFQEPRENIYSVTSGESSVKCSKRKKYGMQPSVLSGGKGEDNRGQETDEVLNSKDVGKYGMQPSVFSCGKGEDDISQETDEVLNSKDEGKQVESEEAGKLSFQELGENISKAEENMLNVVSPRESSRKFSKRGKCKIQPIRSSKRFKYDRLNMKNDPGTPLLVDLNGDSNILRESASNLSSAFATESVKKEVKSPQPKFSDVETHEQAHMDDNLMVTGHNTEKDSVKGKKNVPKSVISQSIKGNKLSKNQIDCRVFLDANKLPGSAQTNSHSLCEADVSKQGLIIKETEQSPIANVILEQLVNECTSAGEQTLDKERGCLGKGGDKKEDKSGDKEDGYLHAQRSSLEKSGQNSTNKSYNPRKLLPIPMRRVKTTPEEVSKAFGLKTSRSGRLIVPPLAHWCNQTIAYDLDGGIIAILDGSSQRKENESAFNFKAPQEKDAVKIQQKLRNAATEIIRTPSSVKKIGKD